MKITAGSARLRRRLGVADAADALTKGMEEKAVEFVKKGAEIYSKA